MTPTERFIKTLQSLKPGDLGLLRTHAGQSLDASLDGFDLFTGLWWPLRQNSPKAPRREVAWLIAKLYAYRPVPHASGATLAAQLGRLADPRQEAVVRRQNKFDELLALPLSQLEPALQWAVSVIAQHGEAIDWVRLTDELSLWERETTRVRWAKQYLQSA